MTPIDELEGAELARAVAKLKRVVPADVEQDHYRPDRDIAQAWELDGEGWRWVFEEAHEPGHAKDCIITKVWKPGRSAYFRAKCYFNGLTEKPGAYATARCRAYIKAKEAEG